MAGEEQPAVGMKFDGAKPRMELLPFEAIEQLAWILTYGAEKYLPDNWRKIADLRHRYLGSLLRHVSAHARGEVFDTDPKTGVKMPHMACAMACASFILADMVRSGDIPTTYDLKGVREAYADLRGEYRATVNVDDKGEAVRDSHEDAAAAKCPDKLEPPFKCSFCDAKFANAAALLQHTIGKHHDPISDLIRPAPISTDNTTPLPVKCRLCGHEADNSIDMQRHYLAEHPLPKLPVPPGYQRTMGGDLVPDPR